MTRQVLASFIAQVGVVDASIVLRRHVIALERMAQGIDSITEDVELRLKILTEEMETNDP